VEKRQSEKRGGGVRERYGKKRENRGRDRDERERRTERRNRENGERRGENSIVTNVLIRTVHQIPSERSKQGK
jgi:hypothetical protein